MPKIIRFHQIGGPENLKFDDLPSAQPGKGEVRIRVHAAGLNRAESMFYHAAYVEEPQLPARLGYEVAGVVEAVGDSVDKGWIGKKVATIPAFSQNRYGTLGEEAIVPATALGEYPAKLSAIEASAIWMQYLTAYGALVPIGGVESGTDAAQFILVGADTVQVCTGVMKFGYECVKSLCEELLAFMEQHKFNTLADFKGRSLPYFTTHFDLVQKQAQRNCPCRATQILPPAERLIRTPRMRGGLARDGCHQQRDQPDTAHLLGHPTKPYRRTA